MRRLLIRPGAIGDCILAFPVLQHLIEEYTEVWISSPAAPLIQFASLVRPLAATGIDLVGIDGVETRRGLREQIESFDSVISWYGESRPEFRTTIESWARHCDFHAALPPKSYEGHATDFFAQQVGAPAGLIPRIEVPCREAERDSIVIHPFSGSEKKNWPLTSFRRLAESIRGKVEWTAGPGEKLEGAVRLERLDDLAKWLAGARLYIGNDSGITHLAAAIGVPVLALFGPSQPETWAPRGKNVTVLRCEPLEALSVETVREAVNQRLG